MTRSRTAIWITLLTAVVLALVGLACTTSFAASAEEEVLTMDATLYWYHDAMDNVVISPRLWTRPSADAEWTIVELDDVDAYLRYVSSDGTTAQVAPTQFGNYTVQIVLGDNAALYRSLSGTTLGPGSVVFERQYRLLPEQLSIVFAPQNNVVQGQYSYSRILNETLVLRAGQPLERDVDYSVSVSKGGVAVTSIADAGEYTVAVTLLSPVGTYSAGERFESVFLVKTNLDGLIAVDSTVRYEGMFYDPTRGDAVAYYTPTFSGTLVSSYEDSYSVTYLTEDGQVLLSAPTFAGTFVARVTLTSAIDPLGLSVGDYVDCYYTILPLPYTVTFRTTAGNHEGSDKFDLYYSPEGIGVLAPVVSNGNDTLDAGYLATSYYKWNESIRSWQAMPLSELGAKGNVISSVGLYRVLFELDYTADGGTSLAGNAWFPGANGFAITQDNNILTCYFEVKSNYTVSGFSSSYVYTGEVLTEGQLNPVVMSRGSNGRGYFEVAYYLDGAPVSRDQVGLESGRYEGVITFDEWILDGDVPYTVTQAGEQYHFWFDVLPKTFVIRSSDTFSHEAFEQNLLDLLCLSDLHHVSLDYLSYHDGYYDVVSKGDFFTQVGFYRLDVTVSQGRYDGYVFSFDFVNRAASSLKQIGVSFDNTTNTVIPYTGMPVVADFDFGDMPDTTRLSILYEQKDGEDWAYCDYPVLPGDYRVRVHFNEACPYFDVDNGAEYTVAFTIKALSFSVEFEVDGTDDVYDGNVKSYRATYYADSRPMLSSEVEMMGVKVLYARATDDPEDLVFDPSARPLEAGGYYFAVTFDDDMRMFGLTAYTGSEYTYANLIGHAVFSRQITVQRLQLAALVDLPSGYGGLYTKGQSLVPSYTFYKYNGSDLSDPAEIAKLEKVEWVNASYYDVQYRRGELGGTGFGNDWIDPSLSGTYPTETGNYQYIIALHLEHGGNLYVAKVATPSQGESLAVDLDMVGGKYGFDRPSVSGVYPINPRPISVVAGALQGNIYYGQAAKVSVGDLSWTTLDQEGDPIPFDESDLDDYVTLSYFERSGSSIVLGGDDLFTAGGLFASGGEYTLRIAFRAPVDAAETLEYSRYTLTGGHDVEDLPLAGFLQAGCYTDQPFRVRSAEGLRAVFEPNFNSYCFDGLAKDFNVRFVTEGEVDVSDALAGKYKVIYKNLLSGIDLSGDVKPTQVGTYSVRVEFLEDVFRYQAAQRQGVYVGYGEDKPYIVYGGTVTYEYAISQPAFLAWEWVAPTGDVRTAGTASSSDYDRYPFDGESKGYGLRFFVNDVNKVSVNLMLHTDYEINYYVRESSGRYTLLTGAPSQVGEYVVELVFLTELDDYRVGDEGNVKIVAYTYADTQDDCFGRSLVGNGGDLVNNLALEYRYLQVAIDKATVTVEGLSVLDKIFDNDDKATTSGSMSPVAKTGALTSQARADFALIIDAVSFAAFDGVGVGEHRVKLSIQWGDKRVILPHASLTSDGVAFLLGQLSEDDKPSWKEAVVRLDESYVFVWQDLKGNVKPRTLSLIADDYTRTYDPYFVDGDFLTYHVSDEDFAFLSSLSVAGITNGKLTDYFVGHLVREDSDNFNVKEDGYAIGFSSDWAWIDNTLTLSDGTTTTLDEQLEYTITSAKYYILRKEITIGTDGDVTRYYDQAEAPIPVVVLSGKLLAGDRIMAEGEFAATRQSERTLDDVGRYAIDFSAVRIYNGLSDRTDNYKIEYTPAYYVIAARTVTIRPDIETNVDRQNYTVEDWRSFAPTPLVKIYNDGAAEINFDPSVVGAHVEGNFTLTPRMVTSERIYRSFAVGSGGLRLVDQDGRDVTHNFNVLPLTNCIYNVRKYVVRLSVGAGYEKTYGSPDPLMTLTEIGNSLRSLGFVLSEDSTASREAGEDVKFDSDGNVLGYDILPTNQGTIKILKPNPDGDDEDVTQYCYVEVENTTYENMSLIKYQLVIKPLPVTVTVREESINRSSRAILPSIVFYDEGGNAVSTAITSTMKSRFGMSEEQTIVEGDNVITPVLLNESDPNFVFTTVPGVLHVVYPENHVTVSVIDVDDDLTAANQYAFVGGRLFKTLQLYQAKTDNGKDPTKSVQTLLPTTDVTVNHNVYVVAVRRDGSFVLLDPEMTEDGLLVSDTQFYYIMVAEVQTWPYYVIAGVVVLALIAVLALVLRAKKRIKIRGKKQKEPKAPKQPKEKAPKEPKQPKERKVKPLRATPVEEREQPVTEAEEQTEEVLPTESSSESLPEETAAPSAEQAEALSPVEPTAQPDPVRPAGPQSVSVTPSDDEEIVIASASRFDEDVKPVESVSQPQSSYPASDDEIVVASSRRRFDDEDDTQE